MPTLFFDISSIGAVLVQLLIFVLVGRLILAWLPPGRLGGHGPHELLRTTSASLLLGLAALTIVSRWALWLSPWPDWRIGSLAVVAGATVLRIATLPAAMVPRHEPAAEHAGAAAQLAGLGIVTIFAFELAGILRHMDWLPQETPDWAFHTPVSTEGLHLTAWCFLAALFVLLDDALAVARRAPFERRGLLLVAALCAWRPILEPGGVAPRQFSADAWTAGWMLVVCGAAATSFAWFRRADRRSLWVALLALAGAASWKGSTAIGFALVAIVFIVASPHPTRRYVAIVVTCLALFTLPCWPLGDLRDSGPPPDRLSIAIHSGTVVAATLAAVLGLRGRRLRPQFAPGCVDEPGRELVLALGFLAGLISMRLLVGYGPWLARGGLPLLEPLAFLAIGLVFLRAERVSHGAS